jgi:hypothetical protein
MPFAQLLASQGWTEIWISISDDCQRNIGYAVGKLTVSGLAALP